MKKILLLAFIICFASLTAFGQGFYFDIGLGLGKGWTKIDGKDVVDGIKDAGVSVSEIAVDIGFKAGYGPFGKLPLYVVGELGGIGHRISDKDNYVQFNSYIIGPGVIFYPIPLIQTALSLGYSFTGNDSDITGYKTYDSKGGFAWNVSAAVDLGKRNHGCLLGIKYFNAINKLETLDVNENASMFGVFVKYAYRKKAPSLF